MKVRKSSWHYRLWRWGRENPKSEPRDLCRYFWHLALVKVLLPLTLALLVVVGIVALIVVIWNNPLETLEIVLGVVAIVAVIAGFILYLKRLEKRQTARRRGQLLGTIPAKEPGIVKQFLLARKRKVCPLIEIVDE